MTVTGIIGQQHHLHHPDNDSSGRQDGVSRPSADGDAIELGVLETEPFLPPRSSDDDDGANAAPSYPAQKTKARPRVIWLTVFFLMNSLAFGISVVPRINLIVSLVCRQTLPDSSSTAPDSDPIVIGGYNPQCQVDAVSSRTAMVQSAGSIVSGVLSMGMSAFLNALSDRVGRVKVMAYAAIVLMGAELVLVALARAPSGTSWKWLFLAYSLDGLSGSFAVIMAMASAYISDCVDEERRNVQVGRIHGSMFIGIAVGPAMSSAIVASSGQKSPLLVFYLGIVMRVISLVYLMTCVTESLPQARKGIRNFFTPSSTRWQHISKPAGGWISTILVKLCKLNPVKWLNRLVPPGSPTSTRMRANVKLLIAINIICYAGAISTGDILVLYPQVVFKWGNVENNMFMSVINGFRAAVSTVGIPVLIFLFQRRRPRSGPSYHPNPVRSTTPATRIDPVTTNTTTSVTLLDPSSFPDIEALTSPTTPQTPTAPFTEQADNDSPLGTRSDEVGGHGLLDPLDRTLILTALLFDIFGYVGYAASPNGVLFTLCGAAAAFGAIGLSTSEAALTKCVQPSNPRLDSDSGRPGGERWNGEGKRSRVGELMAGLGLLQSVVRIVAPALVNAVYGATVAVGWPGMAFWGVAGLLGIGVALTFGLVVG